MSNECQCTPLVNAAGEPYSQLIGSLFGDCVYSAADYVSFVAGVATMILWMFAQFPQLWLNFKRKRVDALSAGLLASWFLGDFTNYLGCILTNQLPTQRYTAAYYTVIDVVILCQYCYYRFLSPHHLLGQDRLSASDSDSDGEIGSDPIAVELLKHSEAQPLAGSLVVSSAAGAASAARRRKRLAALAAAAAPMMPYGPSSVPPSPAFDPRPSGPAPHTPLEMSEPMSLNGPGYGATAGGSSRARPAAYAVLFACLFAGVFTLAPSFSSSSSSAPPALAHVAASASAAPVVSRFEAERAGQRSLLTLPQASTPSLVIAPLASVPTERPSCRAAGPAPGSWLARLGPPVAWTSGLAYLLSRTPQIAHMLQRGPRAAEGLAPSMFLTAFIANGLYGMSVLLRRPKIDESFWLSTLPFIIGSMGTMIFDFTILVLIFKQRSSVGPKMSLHAAVLPKLILTSATAAILAAVASVGGYQWNQADWFSNPETVDHFSTDSFFGLFVLVLCAPLAVSLFVVAITQALRLAADSKRRFTLAAVTFAAIAVLAACVGLGWRWAGYLFECRLGIFCVHTRSHRVPNDPVGVVVGGKGWWATLGIDIVAFFGLVLAAVVCRTAVSAYTAAREPATSLNEPLLLGSSVTDVVVASVSSSGSSKVESSVFSTYSLNRYESADEAAPRKQSIAFKSPKLRRCVGLSALYLVSVTLLAFLFFIASYYPNTFGSLSPAKIAANANKTATSDFDICSGPLWAFYTCPELPGAVLKTGNLQLDDYWILKLYPSNVMFYSFLALFPLVALLIRATPVVDRVLSRKIRVRRVTLGSLFCCCSTTESPSSGARSAFFTLKEVLVTLSLAALAGGFFFYWFHDHNFGAKYPNRESTLIEYWCRALGQVSTLFLALLMFPAARNSPVLALLGVSWEKALAYHRWLGTFFLVAVLGHMGTAWGWYDVFGGFPWDIFRVPQTHTHSNDDFTVPLAQWATWVTLVGIGFFSLWERVRRRSYELFLYAHHISYCLLIPTVLWHAASAWEYLFPGLVIWAVDRAIRVFRSTAAVDLRPIALPGALSAPTEGGAPAQTVFGALAIDCGRAGKIVELRLSAASLRFQPGQYAFLNIAEISLFEWHPFTVSSALTGGIGESAAAANKGDVTFHIKAMGAKTWTDALYNYCLERQTLPDKALPLTVSMDGPYGLPLDCSEFDSIVLVGGGIGLTPCKSIFETLLNSTAARGKASIRTASSGLKKVTLIGTARDHALLSALFADSASTLERTARRADDQSCQFELQLYRSRTEEDAISSEVEASTSSGLASPTPVVGDRDPALTLPLGSGSALAAMTTIGRPALEAAIPGAAASPGTGRTLVFVCGPESLVDKCEELSHEHGYEFHSEVFLM